MNTAKVIQPGSTFNLKVLLEDNDARLDVFLSKHFNAYSRSYFQKLISEIGVIINGKVIKKSSYALRENDEITINFPPMETLEHKPITSDMGIKIIFQHPDFLIIDKPAGVLVHAAESSGKQVTLVDWLISKFKEISAVGQPERPGIVHRLDMNTSGLLIIPRNNYAHEIFGNKFKDKQIKKTYLALVQGHPEAEGIIDFPIARHPAGNKMTAIKKNQKLAMFRGDVREALTNYKTLEYFEDAAYLQVNPQTGRTHQIRVHFAAIGHPLLGDILYGKKFKYINRQALHASMLEFEYEGEIYNFKSEMPEDFAYALCRLREE